MDRSHQAFDYSYDQADLLQPAEASRMSHVRHIAPPSALGMLKAQQGAKGQEVLLY